MYAGAWKSLLELEESLTLAELFILYGAYNNEFTKQIKVSALAAGAEVDFYDDWYDPIPEEKHVIDAYNYHSLPIGIGYEG